MSWLLFAVGLVTLGLAINVLRPSRSFFGMAISFFAEWLVSELAHWTILVLGATVVLLVLLWRPRRTRSGGSGSARRASASSCSPSSCGSHGAAVQP